MKLFQGVLVAFVGAALVGLVVWASMVGADLRTQHEQELEQKAKESSELRKTKYTELGMQAFKAGVPAEANPFLYDQRRVLERISWLNGWIEESLRNK